MAEKRLEGRVALVTGASRGIGRAIALRLAADGAAIALAYGSSEAAAREAEAEARALGAATVLLDADLGDPAAAAGLVARAADALGRVDILVNNAGLTRDGLAVRMSDGDWADVLAVDLTAAFTLCRAALRGMLRARWGRIVNISSVAGVTGNPGQANYSAAKAGLIGLTKALAKEVGGRGITVNAVAPGFVETDMTAGLPAALIERALTLVPAGRLGTAGEVAAAVAFLAAPEAAYITGHVLHVDGGLAA
ncbi:MAG TPA: 3-oxoacyl-[acyl-carrier-protein] reductase [Candidatus Dormibacteraeota bacterium]|nr:3-oxoacyl-[acyl-carrier-protein] reductase [Candidatus Dormibacteraeota bacterium]